jgi:hypothetical protein
MGWEVVNKLLTLRSNFVLIMKTDRTCLWTYERMMLKTEPYCHYTEFYCEQLAMEIKGWFMSRLALDDVVKYECPN